MSRLRPLHYRDLVAVFEKEGFVFSSVPTFIIRNLLRSAGMGRDRYFELLGRKR